MLAVAFLTIGTITNRFDVINCTINGVAGWQENQSATQSQDCQKFFHILSPMLQIAEITLALFVSDNRLVFVMVPHCDV